MRIGKASRLMLAMVMAVLLTAPTATMAHEEQEYPGPDSDAPLVGYTRSDGTVVLDDESFCRFLLGSIWGDERLTFVDLIDKSKKQKPARRAAFAAASDEASVQRCTDVLGASRTPASEGDTLVAWARRSPVVPEALASLLPEDFVAQPLVQPDEVGDAARTSGFGDMVSGPFLLDGETWLAAVDAVECATWSGTLHDARDPERAIELREDREFLYAIEPGHYYWEVTAPACDWSVDLAPIDLGPDPDATPVPQVPVPSLHGERWTDVPTLPNPEFLYAIDARAALLDAGLTVGECTEGPSPRVFPGRVWGQDPPAGTLVDLGTPIDVFATSDCDIIRGERVPVD